LPVVSESVQLAPGGFLAQAYIPVVLSIASGSWADISTTADESEVISC
jgi:hypothetical protein